MIKPALASTDTGRKPRETVMKKLSIIIPIYNVEEYLAKCLESVCRGQGLTPDEYEVIVVNDGTPDNSREIAVELAAKYPNIVIQDRPNGGLSAARNTGLDVAQGKYVIFVDSDDYLEPDCLGKAIEQLESHDADVLSFCFMFNLENGSVLDTTEPPPTPEFRTFPAHDFLTHPKRCLPAACKYIYKRSLFQDHDIRFYVGILHEDCEFTPRILFHAQKVLHWNKGVYWVLERAGSITRNPELMNRRFDSYKKVLLSLLAFAKEHAKSPRARRALGTHIDNISLVVLKLTILDGDLQKVKDIVSFLRQNHLYPFPYRRWNIGIRASVKRRLKRAQAQLLKLKLRLTAKKTGEDPQSGQTS